MGIIAAANWLPVITLLAGAFMIMWKYFMIPGYDWKLVDLTMPFVLTLISLVLMQVLVTLLLPILETVFSVTTDITLPELADLNRPILRRLMLEAPGTYHHSLVVGSLAEAGAEAIGGNPLLGRVGAYYHEIGKIEKAEYYVENQSSARSRHEKLSPTMSCLIIEAHVREGAEIARKERLPRAIVDSILEHHGTTLMSFFFHKAREADANAEERDFRYPGPKPRSKETAVLMLADAVEAAARSLSEPTPSRIRASRATPTPFTATPTA
jgi:putative nucleotidyltransferase with HDIG domain